MSHLIFKDLVENQTTDFYTFADCFSKCMMKNLLFDASKKCTQQCVEKISKENSHKTEKNSIHHSNRYKPVWPLGVSWPVGM